MKTIKIKGKDYVTVNERIKVFRENYSKWTLDSVIENQTENEITIKAIISDEEGRVVATGRAHENQKNGLVNKTSHIENCETSAWGRALGNLGIGIDTSIASADEVESSISLQDNYETETPDNFKRELTGQEKTINKNELEKLVETMIIDDVIFEKMVEASKNTAPTEFYKRLLIFVNKTKNTKFSSLNEYYADVKNAS